MVSEQGCQQRQEEEYWPVEEKKEEKSFLHRSLTRPLFYSEKNLC